MTAPARMHLDVAVFGGGIAGLWTLTQLRQAGYRALLLESDALGTGQTVASQGILHGGLKYTLANRNNPSAAAIADMPLIWRKALAGEISPDLRGTRMRGEFCHLWRTKSLTSRFAFLGARAGLRVKPVRIPEAERPPALLSQPGPVARLDEQVVEPTSMLGVLADLNAGFLWTVDSSSGVEFEQSEPGAVDTIRLINPEDGSAMDLLPRLVILAAGAGNATLRVQLGLDASPDESMQRRPLHMVVMKGRNLPILNGHCVDGRATRLTITSTVDAADDVVWQLGGQVSERGVDMEPAQLMRHARDEVRAVLPGLNLDGVRWCTYRVDRAEHRTPGGKRPEHAYIGQDARTITIWPTKLVLAPVVGDACLEAASKLNLEPGQSWETLPRALHWPTPAVALPPWELEQSWIELLDTPKHG